MQYLAREGLHVSDLRIKRLLALLSPEEDGLSAIPVERFSRLLEGEAAVVDRSQPGETNLLLRALLGNLCIPDFSAFCESLSEMHASLRSVCDGAVAEYIPVLKHTDPSLWGVAICTVDGQRWSTGDCSYPFSIQACGAPFMCKRRFGRGVGLRVPAQTVKRWRITAWRRLTSLSATRRQGSRLMPLRSRMRVNGSLSPPADTEKACLTIRSTTAAVW